MMSRRGVLGSFATLFCSSRPLQAHSPPQRSLQSTSENMDSDWYVGVVPDEPFDIPAVDLRRIHPAYHRQPVWYAGPEQPGTVVVETSSRFLYLVGDDGTAIRYGIGVGREGFSWSGTALIERKARWPGWTPPAEMRKRQPDLPPYMEGGLNNPLGARALYLYQDGRDTLYRIHGTNEPWSIGHAVSSGCVRLLNEDVVDLYGRIPLGTEVVVKPNSGRSGQFESKKQKALLTIY